MQTIILLMALPFMGTMSGQIDNATVSAYKEPCSSMELVATAEVLRDGSYSLYLDNGTDYLLIPESLNKKVYFIPSHVWCDNNGKCK